MSVTLGDKHPSYSAVKNWVARFRKGHLSTENKERSGRPTPVKIPENHGFFYKTQFITSCNNTFSKWREGLRMACRTELSSTPLKVWGLETS
jgi:hypothetical protein